MDAKTQIQAETETASGSLGAGIHVDSLYRVGGSAVRHSSDDGSDNGKDGKVLVSITVAVLVGTRG
ncbi:hypothetical protein FB645_003529 [Coemansia sp. IMI 203386]|nr:hypothetical protein FB645_003529 [Coemansia sp. IMI 203386]